MSTAARNSHEPPQVAPVARPFLYRPHEVIELERGNANELVASRMALLHGANHNDPHYFSWPTREQMRAR